MSEPKPSIFRRYFQPETLVDRFLKEPSRGIDVVIPVLHTNELWETNLHSIYREIPVRRLLLGDGGCIDETLPIARKFPRVVVEDHRAFKSLGFSIRKLIESVETEWFVYLHSDVWLPEGWFDTMQKSQERFDWFECRQHLTVMLDYPQEYAQPDRPYSGSQMGRKAAFEKVLPRIDDDFLYRNEDIIYASLVEEAGFRYGRVDETFHYHQHMLRRSPFQRKVFVSFKVEPSREEEERAAMMQAKGLVKYMRPNREIASQITQNVRRLIEIEALTRDEFTEWTRRTNPSWLPWLDAEWPRPGLRTRLRGFIRRLLGRTS